jgi:iron complex outermembrane recepter protein
MKFMTPAVVLAAAPPAFADDAATETTPPPEQIIVTGTRYTLDAASSGTKTDTPLLDTPMAIQIVPKDVIEDRQLRTLLDAVKNVSGVQSPVYRPGSAAPGPQGARLACGVVPVLLELRT